MWGIAIKHSLKPEKSRFLQWISFIFVVSPVMNN